MSRFLHRPMFRRGGSTGEGITSGLRQGYQGGKLAQVQQDLNILNTMAPQPTIPKSRAGADFWLNFGSNILAQPGGKPILQTLGTASKEATNPVTQQPFESQEEAFDSLIQKSLMSKESFKTEEALYNETVDTLFNTNLKDQNFKGNNLAARTLAEHEAKVIHGHYPKDLVDQLDTQTTYIDSVYVDVDAQGNMKLNNIGKNVGYRPNKVYFNISDKTFYKLSEDGITFTVVDITDFQD